MMIGASNYNKSCNLFFKFDLGWSIPSDFWDMGPHRACEVNTDGLRRWGDIFYFWERGSLEYFLIDDELPYSWYLKMIFSHG